MHNTNQTKKNMKIQINTSLLCDNLESEIDVDALADALDSDIESKVDAFVDSAVDSCIQDYNFYDLVNDQVRDIISNTDFSYEVESCMEESDIDQRVTELEEVIARLSLALPSKAFEAATAANEELQTKYSELETKFKKMAGLDGIEEDQI